MAGQSGDAWPLGLFDLAPQAPSDTLLKSVLADLQSLRCFTEGTDLPGTLSEGRTRMAATRSLEALGLSGDPTAKPLSYPGVLPGEDGVLVDGCYLPLRHAPARQVGNWLVEIDDTPIELDVLLEKEGRPITGDRFPVSDHIRDNRYHGAGHLRKINERIGNGRSDRDRLFSNLCNTHGKLAFSSVNNT